MDDPNARLAILIHDLGNTPIPVVGPQAPALVVAQSPEVPPEPTAEMSDGQLYYDHYVCVATGSDQYRLSYRIAEPAPVTCANGHGPAVVLYGQDSRGPWLCGDCHRLDLPVATRAWGE